MNDNNSIVRHPFRFRASWSIVYILAISLIVFLAGSAAMGIRTHSLPTGSVKLSVPYSKYLVGETISFTIQNNYNSSINVVNNCPAEPLAVYYQVNGSWVRQHGQALLDECPNEDRQVSVKPGGSIDGSFKPWQNLFGKPGKYRIVAFVEYYNALPYQDIEVIASESPKGANQDANSAVNGSSASSDKAASTTSQPQTTTGSVSDDDSQSDD